MDIRIETKREEDGRWLAEVMGLPGVMAYGTSKLQAIARLKHWHSAHWPNAWNITNPTRRVFPSHWTHEPLAFHQGQEGSGRT